MQSMHWVSNWREVMSGVRYWAITGVLLVLTVTSIPIFAQSNIPAPVWQHGNLTSATSTYVLDWTYSGVLEIPITVFELEETVGGSSSTVQVPAVWSGFGSMSGTHTAVDKSPGQYQYRTRFCTGEIPAPCGDWSTTITVTVTSNSLATPSWTHGNIDVPDGDFDLTFNSGSTNSALALELHKQVGGVNSVDTYEGNISALYFSNQPIDDYLFKLRVCDDVAQICSAFSNEITVRTGIGTVSRSLDALPDSGFRACAAELLFDYLYIQLTNVSTLNCDNRSIESVVGLKLFSALQTLNVSNNPLTDQDNGLNELSDTPALSTLGLSQTQIDAMPQLHQLQALQSVDLANNPALASGEATSILLAAPVLQSLDISGNTHFQCVHVDLLSNAITSTITPSECVPDYPANFYASPNPSTDGEISLHWELAPVNWQVDYYELELTPVGGSTVSTQINVSDPQAGDYPQSLGNSTAEYEYRIRSCSSTVCGDWSPVLRVQVNAFDELVSPENVAFVPEGNYPPLDDGFRLEWSYPEAYFDSNNGGRPDRFEVWVTNALAPGYPILNLEVIEPVANDGDDYRWSSRVILPSELQGNQQLGDVLRGLAVFLIVPCYAANDCGPMGSTWVNMPPYVGDLPPEPGNVPHNFRGSWDNQSELRYHIEWDYEYPINTLFSIKEWYDLNGDDSCNDGDPSIVFSFGNTRHLFDKPDDKTGLYCYQVAACIGGLGCATFHPNPAFEWIVDTSAGAIQGPPDSVSATWEDATPSHPYRYTLSWTAPAGAATYNLEEQTPGQSWNLVAGDITQTSLLLEKAAGEEGQYHYRVNACNGSGQCSEWAPDNSGLVVNVNQSGGSGTPDPVPAIQLADPPSANDPAILASAEVGTSAGEFRVDESGNANYGIPILTAPGSGGVAPQIGLGYSSQGGNGPLGVGWSVTGLSAISRCAQTIEQEDSTPTARGVTLTMDDRFCLDGQRLMLVPGTGNYGAAGSEYRLEIDDFTKVIAHDSQGNGPAYFEVWRKDGSRSEYGNSSDSRIESAASGSAVFSWAQNHFEDSAGNYIEYLYNEFDAVNAGIEFHIDRILYTGNSRAGTQPYNELKFNYSSGRTDTAEGYLAGVKLQSTQLLTRIDSRARVTAGGALQWLRAYTLHYDDGDTNPNDDSDGLGRKIIHAIEECNDAAGSVCYPATVFTWDKSLNAINGTNATTVNWNDSEQQFQSVQFGDIDGNGDAETIFVTRKNGEYLFAIGEIGNLIMDELPPNAEGEMRQWSLVDYDADGFTDIVYNYQGAWQGRSWNGTTFVAPVTIGTINDSNDVAVLKQALDFDGDGLTDLLYRQGTQLFISFNQAGASTPIAQTFTSPILINLENTDDDFQPITVGSETYTQDGVIGGQVIGSVTVFDYNGDGAVDILWRDIRNYVSSGNQSGKGGGGESSGFKKSHWYVMLSDRSLTNPSFGNRQLIAYGSDCAINFCPGPGNPVNLPVTANPIPTDVNGDGLADLLYLNHINDQWQYQVNTGSGLLPAVSVGVVPENVELHVQMVDYNGDGRVDILYPSAPGAGNATWQAYLSNESGGFDASIGTGVPAGNIEGEGEASIFTDLNGDGKLDQWQVERNNLGEIEHLKIRWGHNVAPGATQGFTNAITQISDGFGAETDINYAPLTDSQVYTRLFNATDADWGNGSVVYDVIMPVYVVSQISSSAPLDGSPNAESHIQYHYAGARLQGGGRGFLGFSEVITFDPQSSIRTATRYRQDFPYIGTPADTTQSLLTMGEDPWQLTAADTGVTLPVWPVAGTAAVTRDVVGTVISYAINEWDSNITLGNAQYPYIKGSIERSFTLDGRETHSVLTGNIYGDNYGNATAVEVKTYNQNNQLVATQSTSNTYHESDGLNGDDASWINKWFLGRLATSVVETDRPGTALVRRESAFNYDTQTGILTEEIVEPNNSQHQVVTGYTLDLFGNRLTTTVSSPATGDAAISTRSSSVTYDALGRYVQQSHNAYGQLVQNLDIAGETTRDAYGNPLMVEDIHGARAESTYDAMGRAYFSRSETGAWNQTRYQLCIDIPGNCPAAAEYRIVSTAAGSPESRAYYDKLGREVRRERQTFNGSFSKVDTFYDESGRVHKVSEPVITGQQYWTVTSYDEVGRPEVITLPDSSDTTYSYDVSFACNGSTADRLTVRMVDEPLSGIGQTRIESKNALGETVCLEDNDGGEIIYGYDSIGNLMLVRGADLVSVTMSYDFMGRKIGMNDPDKGIWSYRYDVLGQLTRQRDSKNQAVDFEYDLLGRIINRYDRTDVDSLGDQIFNTVSTTETIYQNQTGSSVSGKGQIIVEKILDDTVTPSETLHQRDYDYDGFGRVSVRTTAIGGQGFTETTRYDQFGRLFQQFDASGGDRGIRYHYNSFGHLNKLQEAREGSTGSNPGVIYQEITAMDARGNITSATLGGNIDTSAIYDQKTGYLLNLMASDGNSIPVQDLSFIWDSLGTLKQRHDQSGGKDLKEDFYYDSLYRLNEVQLTVPELNNGLPVVTQTVRYNEAGNIICKSDVGTTTGPDACGSGSTLINYTYGQNAGPHAVTDAGGVAYTYDANGNQISGDGRSITYTVFDKPRQIVKGSHTSLFDYGVDRSRFRRTDTGTNSKTTLYVGAVEIIDYGVTTEYRRYIAGIAIAHYYPSTNVTQVDYLLKDHIGSTDVIIQHNGTVQAMSFDAWGRQRLANDWSPLGRYSPNPLSNITDRGFTGHEHVSEAGIIHMNGRIYDPVLGRFLQADPVVQAPENAQNLNRYSYVLNNPLSYTDPSGFSFKRIFKRALFGLFGHRILKHVASNPILNTIASVAACSVGPAVCGAYAFLSNYAVTGDFGRSLKAGLIAGVSTKVFGKIGGLKDITNSTRILLHATAGGVMSELQGGKFGHGFVSAGLTKAFSLGFAEKLASIQSAEAQTVIVATVGGSISVITGGKFVNGAQTAAIAYLYNQLSSLNAEAEATWNRYRSKLFGVFLKQTYEQANVTAYGVKYSISEEGFDAEFVEPSVSVSAKVSPVLSVTYEQPLSDLTSLDSVEALERIKVEVGKEVGDAFRSVSVKASVSGAGFAEASLGGCIGGHCATGGVEAGIVKNAIALSSIAWSGLVRMHQELFSTRIFNSD